MITPYRKIQYLGIIILFSLILGGCRSDGSRELGRQGYIGEFIGGVAADEPRAALEGQKILSAGGNAVDAATAVYFTLAVTLPSRASLGGGGICMVFDHKTKNILALDFLSQVPLNIPKTASRPSAVPGNPLGFFLLHNRFGRFQWESLVTIGETLARFGTMTSRVLINDLAPVATALMADPESRRVFLQKNGNLISEGTLMRQLNLASVLSQLKQSGPFELYRGKLSRRFVEGVEKAGGSLSSDDLTSYKPKWKKVLSRKFGNHEINFAPPPASGGLVSAQMFGMLEKNDLFDDASTNEKYHILVETALRSLIDRNRWLRDDFSIANNPKELISDAHLGNLIRNYRVDRHLLPKQYSPHSKNRAENPSATSFVVVDRDGSAVACTLTMNNNFGTGRMAQGTGILLAAAPTDRAKGPTALSPIIVRNRNTNNLFFVGAVSGGIAAPTALVSVISRLMIGNKRLSEAISMARVHHSGIPDITYYEPHLAEVTKSFLIQRGHQIAATPTLGFVNAIYCSGGLPVYPDTCIVKSDPRGNGLATSAGE
jgi:gamma-glutamyltranspeptidase / glutathione hydrolase